MTNPNEVTATTPQLKDYMAGTEGSSSYRERAYRLVAEHPSDAPLILAAETAAAVKSVRRILIWTMVILPIVLIGIAIVLGVAFTPSAPTVGY